MNIFVTDIQLQRQFCIDDEQYCCFLLITSFIFSKRAFKLFQGYDCSIDRLCDDNNLRC